MQAYEIDVLRLTKIDRDTGTVTFLYRGAELRREDFPAVLDRLQEQGWVERSPNDRWLITQAGTDALTEAENWEFLVEEVFRVRDGQQPFIVGLVRRGVIRKGHFFRIIRAGVDVGDARVASLELVQNRSRPDSVTITTDGQVGLEVGDLLRRWEPLAE